MPDALTADEQPFSLPGYDLSLEPWPWPRRIEVTVSDRKVIPAREFFERTTDTRFVRSWNLLDGPHRDELDEETRSYCLKRYADLLLKVEAQMARLGSCGEAPEESEEPEYRGPEEPGYRGPEPDLDRDLLGRGFWASDAKLNVKLPYVVKGLFGREQIIVLWGPPGSGKTFVSLEISHTLGAKAPWRGRRTKGGIVIYVAAESARAYLENRIVAIKQEFPALAKSEVFVVPVAVDLLHSGAGDVDRVIESARVLGKEIGEVVLIVIDTLAVTMRGGNENAPDDMGTYVGNIQRIRTETGAAVLLVHHCGKDEARGMRGHSALLAALDAELAVEMGSNGERILRTGKVRDGDGWSDLFAFRLRPVDLGADADGDPVTTCVVESLDENGTKRVRRERKGSGLGANQRTVLRAVEAAGGRIPRVDLAHKLKDEGMPRNRVHQAIGSLLENGMLVAHNDVDPPEVSLP
ncbi:MAG: AAA family ATPase [Burkholderiales bacterium]|nr:AAA family ATPase [Burkholderiales bacterium]